MTTTKPLDVPANFARHLCSKCLSKDLVLTRSDDKTLILYVCKNCGYSKTLLGVTAEDYNNKEELEDDYNLSHIEFMDSIYIEEEELFSNKLILSFIEAVIKANQNDYAARVPIEVFKSNLAQRKDYLIKAVFKAYNDCKITKQPLTKQLVLEAVTKWKNTN